MKESSILNGYKQTKAGIIPIECDLGEISTYFQIITGTTPSTSEVKYWNSGTNIWITPTDLSANNGAVFINRSERKITNEAVMASGLKRIPKGSILLSTRAPVGHVAISDEDVYINQGCKGLVPSKSQSDPFYYYFYLLSQKNLLNRFSGGSTFNELSKKTLEKLNIPIPPLNESNPIGKILFCLEEAITTTEAIIARTEELKRGFMQVLLARGIDEEGRIRSEETHAFKDSPIGRVPVEWDVGPINDIAKINPRNNFTKTSADTFVSFLPMENVNEDGKIISLEIRRFGDVQTGYTPFIEGDILFAKITPCMENGKGAIAENLCNGIGFGSTEFHILRPREKDSLDFIHQLTNYPEFRVQATRFFTGSAGQKRVSKDMFFHYLIPIPPLPERRDLATILTTFDTRITINHQHCDQLQTLKRGLMQDLLTGRIRVPEEMRQEVLPSGIEGEAV